MRVTVGDPKFLKIKPEIFKIIYNLPMQCGQSKVHGCNIGT